MGENLGLLQNFHSNSVYFFLYRAEIQSILKCACYRDYERYYKLGEILYNVDIVGRKL